MRLLLDTHVALWALVDSPRLGAQARAMLADPANELAVSAACLWEIAIKHGLGRGDMPVSSERALAYFRQAGYRMVSVTAEHTVAVERLPAIHADPFDRLMVAQAIVEPFRLVTADATVARYGGGIILI